MVSSRSPRALAAAGLVACLAAIGCTKAPPKRSETPPAPVVVASAVTKTMPVQIRTIGSVKSVSTFSVKPRVSGLLTEVHFVEGQDVKKKQKLFTLDAKPFEAAVEQAAATLDKDKALLGGAQLDFDRAQRAVLTGVGSREELDQAQTRVASAKASVAADEAALQAAKLQLGYTTIYSEIDGRTGELQITPGNLVSPTDMIPLAVVIQITPIDVIFAVPEHLLPQIDQARQSGPLSVTVTHHPPRNGDQPTTGELAFSDNTVDTTTGTVQLKAKFANEDRKLWPGQFVDVVLTTGSRPNSVVVPLAAIQSGQAGPYVYIVNGEKKVELRQVEIAFQQSGEAVIESGLTGGETVVVEGQLRLAPGVSVDVKKTLPAPKDDPRIAPASRSAAEEKPQ